MFAFPMIQDWNTTTRLWLRLGSTDAGLREIEREVNLSVDICESRLQSFNDVYDNITNSLEQIVDLINSGVDGLLTDGAKEVWLMMLVYWVMISKSLVVIRFLLMISQLVFYIFTHCRKIILTFLQFRGGLLKTSNLNFLHLEYVISINPNMYISLYI